MLWSRQETPLGDQQKGKKGLIKVQKDRPDPFSRRVCTALATRGTPGSQHLQGTQTVVPLLLTGKASDL